MGIEQEENVGKCLQQNKFRICLEMKECWWKESTRTKCLGVVLTDIAGLSLHKQRVV